MFAKIKAAGKKASLAIVSAIAVVAAPQAMAAEAVYTSLTDGVVVTNMIAALFAVAVVMVGLYLARKGIYIVLGMLKSKG